MCTDTCTAQFVNVTCGPTTRQKRHAVVHEITRRSSRHNVYTVSFDLTVALSNLSSSASFGMTAIILTQMAMKIEEEVRSGHFDIPRSDMHLESDSFYQDMIEYKCPRGMQSRMTSGSCGMFPILSVS